MKTRPMNSLRAAGGSEAGQARLLVESMSVAGFTATPEGLLIFVNAWAAFLLGRAKEELLGRNLGDFVAASDSVRFSELLKVSEGMTTDARLEFVSASGGLVPMHVWANRVARPEDEIICLVGTDVTRVDACRLVIKQLEWQREQLRESRVEALNLMQEAVSARREAEHSASALRDAEQRIQQALRVSRSYTFEWEPITDKVVRSASCGPILGLAGDEAINDTGHNYFQRIHPEDRSKFSKLLGGLSPGAPDYAVEYRLESRAGRPLVLEEVGKGAFDAGGKLVRLVGVVSDITKHKLAEETAKRLHETVVLEKERLAALINNISDEIWFADKEGIITLANPSAAREFGIEGDREIDLHNFIEGLQVFRPDGSPRTLEESPPLRALKGELVVNQEELVLTPATGELRYRQVNASPVRDADGNIYGAVAIVRDITDLKRIEVRIRDVNHELESRVAERTAELRSALDALEAENANRQRLEQEILEITDREQARIGQDLHDGACQELAGLAVLAEVVARNLGRKNPEARARMHEISRLARQSADDVRRLASGLLPIKIEQRGLKGALQEFAGEIGGMNGLACRFVMRTPVCIPVGSAAVQLFRIAQEATSNALRHAKAKYITIKLSQSGDAVTLVIEDDGVGTPRGENKSGMGLHTMQYRARFLGGSLEIRPAAKRGTAVVCSFPAKVFAPPEESAAKEDPPEDQPRRKQALRRKPRKKHTP